MMQQKRGYHSKTMKVARKNKKKIKTGSKISYMHLGNLSVRRYASGDLPLRA
jgi:hypothetical protein